MGQYKECIEMKRGNCSDFLMKSGDMQMQCSIDQNTCASSFVGRYPVGTFFVGTFDRRDLTKIYDHFGPSFAISGSLVTQLVICTVFGVVFLVAAVHVGSEKDKTKNTTVDASNNC